MTQLIAGVDEAGRGPLAGPVIAAAVILKASIEGLNDSKLLSEKKRARLAQEIEKKALCFSYGRAEPEEIDALNIHHATLLAMKRAVEGLSLLPNRVWVDGLFVPELNIPADAFVKGDQRYPVISAASILAKVLRDEEMKKWHDLYPEYGFQRHKGYPTPFHRQALMQFGPCPIHRKTFKV